MNDDEIVVDTSSENDDVSIPSKKSRAWTVTKKITLRGMILFVLLACTAGVGGVTYFINQSSAASIPSSPTNLEQKTPITITASDGNTVLARISPKGGVREIVDGEHIASTMKQSVVAAEDSTFYDNLGFAPKRIAKASLGHLQGSTTSGGGSTITQQFVKNVLVGDEYSYDRKWREILSSSKLTASWSKDDILTAYLNTVYFGRGALGVEKAAEAYFGVHASELTLPQSILLAGVIQSPSRWDPNVDPQGSSDRFTYVADQMLKSGNITTDQRSALVFPKTVPPKPLDASIGLTDATGHIVSLVLAEATAKGMNTESLFSRGARIVSTIDTKVQDAVSTKARQVATDNDVKVGVTSVDPLTGGIKGTWGGDDGIGFDYANSPQMTGSTFKVFTLAAALENGITLGTLISSDPYQVGDSVLNNSEGMSCGVCSVAEATKQSLNTSFYRIQDMLPKGPFTTRETAHRMGMEAPLSEPDGSVTRSVTLGAYGASTAQMAGGYATAANGGVRNDRHIIDSVYTRNDQLIYKSNPHPTRVLKQSTADDISKALEPIAAYSNGHQLSGKTGYMKTGTVQLGDTGQNRDAYVVGYTKWLSTAVWVGNETGGPLTNASGAAVWGAGLPSDIWQSVMNDVG